ncbi:phage tail assembly protein [Vibrio atlanticus]|uniref:Phage tail assembly protein n=1 Tax=Vibrio atlanticus TaxID=693153 RepID=A0ABV4KS46_9VIBR
MAVLTFDLKDGLKSGETTGFEVGLRELTPRDVFDAQLASEKLGLIEGRPYAYTSNVQMGMELLCRQVEFIGKIQGPFSAKELLKLSQDDFNLIQLKASELDAVMVPEEVTEALESRGRSEVAD